MENGYLESELNWGWSGRGGREEGDMALVGMVRDEGGWRGMRRGRAGRRGGRGRGEDMGDVRGGMGV